MNHVVLMVKGFFVGIALIIPGLSGGTLAVYLGIYEKLLHAIGHVLEEFWDSVRFLVPLFAGIGIAIVSLANLVGYLIDVNSLIVLLFFMGLIVGGIPDIYHKANADGRPLDVSSILAGVVSFSLVILLVVFSKLDGSSGIAEFDIDLGSVLLLFVLGMAASMTMIVPGVSGSALLIVLGYYTAIVTNVVGQIFDFSRFWYHVQVLIPFALGAAFGIILLSKGIEYALRHYTKQTYVAILGFITGSVVAMFFEIKDPASGASHDLQTPIYSDLFAFLGENIVSLLIGLVLFALGAYLARRLTKLELRDTPEETL
jgi:putative membrane protein